MLIGLSKKQRAVGLDIADHTIEVAEIERRGETINILSLGRIKLSPGVVERGRIKNKEKLAWTVREVFINAKPREIKPENIIFGLPETLTYAHIVELKTNVYLGSAKSKSKLRNLISGEILKIVPLSEENLAFSYKTLGSKDEKITEILTISADQSVILEWRNFFLGLGWEIEGFDAETLAVRRALTYDSLERNANFMIVDIGEVKTSISIFDEKSQLRYSHSFPIAGDAMRDELANALSTSRKKAEELKIRIGLSDPESKIFSVLIKVLEQIGNEIELSLKYFRKKNEMDIREIVFVGGSSQLIGLTEYFGMNLGLGVSIGSSGEVVVSLEKTGSKVFDVKRKQGIPNLLYLEAVGLAVRLIEDRWAKIDPLITAARLGKEREKDVESPKPEDDLTTDITPPEGELLLGNAGEDRDAEKVKTRKKILLGILVFGIIIVALLFLYRQYERERSKEDLKVKLREFENNLNVLEIKLKELELEGSEEVEEPPPGDEKEPPDVEPTEGEIKKVTILDTPTGWLNVRGGAGVDYPKTDLVYPGESYPLLEEIDRWYKIKLDSGKEGWISAEYGKVE